MERTEIFERIETICRQLFGEGVRISEETASSDIEQWDSMNHVLLIDRIENEFGVKFELLEIIEISGIRDFINLIVQKTA